MSSLKYLLTRYVFFCIVGIVRYFGVHIKSHCEAPDFEMEVEAETKAEAIKRFEAVSHMDIDDCVEFCPECGSIMEVKREERQGKNFEEVGYCKNCGLTSTP